MLHIDAHSAVVLMWCTDLYICECSDHALICLQVLVDGSRWTKFRDKVEKIAEPAGKKILPQIVLAAVEAG